jgi:hypothetical protein
MPLTDFERTSVLRHLSYTVLSTPTTLSLGYPMVTQANLIAENNMRNLTAAGEKLTREQLERLNCVEKKIDEVSLDSDIAQTGAIKFRQSEALADLRQRYKELQQQLADMLGAHVNPLSYKDPARGVVEPC